MRSGRLARFRQFRWKLAATFIVLAAPPLAVAALYVFFVVPGDLENEAVDSLRVQHRAGTDLVNGYLAGAEEDARVLARVPTILALASDADSILARRKVESHFRIVLEEHENYLQLRYLDASGHEVVRVDRAPGGSRVLATGELQDKSQRYYVAVAVELPPGEVYVSPIDLNREHGEIEQPYVPVVRFVAQVRGSDGALSGLVVINVAAAGLLESLRAGAGAGAAAPGRLMLVDEDGYFILHTDPGRSWSGPRDLDTGWNYFDQLPELATLPSVSAEGPGADAYPSGRELEAAGSQIVAGYVGPPSADERWLLVATASRSEILAPANRLRLTLLAVFAVMALAGLAVIWFAAGRLAGPARSLREGAARIGGGDFEHRIDLASSDELGEVAEAFNSMAAQLRDSYSVLERRVADRTRDLEERDEKLRALGEMGIGLVEELSPHAVVERASVAARRLVDAQSVELIRWEEGGHVERHVTVRDDGVAARPAETAERLGERVRIPIAAHGRTLGELRIVGRADARPFTDTDRDLLETLASHVAVALVNARLHARERESVAQLEELNRAKSDFVSAVSHQLQSPVAAVRGYADILRSHGGDLAVQQRERMINEIAEQTLNLGEIVDDVLRVSRIDSGRLDVVLRPCLLEPVIAEAARDAEGVKLVPRIRLHRPERPLIVSADPASLKQAFLNLMDNALKYSPRGSPVDVGWRVSPERRAAVVDVWDRGPGIPPDDRERIFERFVRLAPTAGRPDVHGTGLGLYIARSIVEAHGGDIRVEDGEAGGTRVALRLPLSDGEA